MPSAAPPKASGPSPAPVAAGGGANQTIGVPAGAYNGSADAQYSAIILDVVLRFQVD